MNFSFHTQPKAVGHNGYPLVLKFPWRHNFGFFFTFKIILKELPSST